LWYWYSDDGECLIVSWLETNRTSKHRLNVDHAYYLSKTMQYFGGACVFMVLVTAMLGTTSPSCLAYPVPADSEDGYRFQEDYPDALQITCTAPVRWTPCATGPADRKPRHRPADHPRTRYPRAAVWRDDTSVKNISRGTDRLIIRQNYSIIFAIVVIIILLLLLLRFMAVAIVLLDLHDGIFNKLLLAW